MNDYKEIMEMMLEAEKQLLRDQFEAAANRYQEIIRQLKTETHRYIALHAGFNEKTNRAHADKVENNLFHLHKCLARAHFYRAKCLAQLPHSNPRERESHLRDAICSQKNVIEGCSHVKDSDRSKEIRALDQMHKDIALMKAHQETFSQPAFTETPTARLLDLDQFLLTRNKVSAQAAPASSAGSVHHFHARQENPSQPDASPQPPRMTARL